ncbi:MAG: ddlA [Candidatus Midichloriaceae bacterium]|jgi:D-alanine-D-alanine ligase|nr:ddlA [Candidatus Midichloriaceae bacterium]
MTKRVAVLMGGKSSEREVSLNSGKSIVAALKSLGYEVFEIDPSHNLLELLSKSKPDVIYNALHGTYGEDGAIPGLLEVLGIPYTHSGIEASAVGMNKWLTRIMLENCGIKFPEGKKVKVADLLSGIEPMKRPYVIKPISQGSTVGVYIIKDGDPSFADQQSTTPWKYGEEALVEEYIPGQEISTAVISGKAIGSLELKPLSGFYDYESKYTDGKTEHIYPANLPEDIYKESLRFAEIAHNILGCRCVSRSDMRYNPEKCMLYFLEINTHPGFTNLSIVPELAEKNGIPFEKLVSIILADAKLELNAA